MATFTSARLKQIIQLKGTPSVDLAIGSNQETFDVCIALSKLNKYQNNVEQLSTGFLRVTGEDAGKTSAHKVILQPLLADLQIGEFLRISISGSCWPAIGVNPGLENEICGPPSARSLVITLKIDLSKSRLQFSPLVSL